MLFGIILLARSGTQPIKQQITTLLIALVASFPNFHSFFNIITQIIYKFKKSLSSFNVSSQFR